jgi:phage/plasmid-like protein (TIGR03299 family)
VTGLQVWPDRKVLTRSDTGAPLAVVSKDYKVVQPGEVMDFFGKLADIGGFQMETAGALSDGKRVWALARVGDGAPVVDGDLVKPYLLLGTSYDGTMATIAKFTAIRVVCNNTITPAVNSTADEIDKGYLKSSVRVLHSERFDADAVRLQLGIVANQFERFMVQSRQLSHVPMSASDTDLFIRELLKPYHNGKIDLNETRAYKRVLDLFENRKAIGSDIPGVAGTRWAMWRIPCGMTSPNSPSKPRIWFAWAVRAFTNPWRTRCTDKTACCSTLLIGTKRMLGRLTASQIASASAASFLFVFTYGFTNCGAISRTVCPKRSSMRPQ